MSVNSRLKATKIRGQREALDRQRIAESSCARKETVDIDILVTSRKGVRLEGVQNLKLGLWNFGGFETLINTMTCCKSWWIFERWNLLVGFVQNRW